MPRIINAYGDNSVLSDTLSRLGEAIYGDQAKNEVSRQKAFGQKNINDLATDSTVGLDDPRLAKAQLAIGGSASGTFPGQGRALANDRFTNAATNAAGERNNFRNNAETHYSTDRRYDSDIATTGMNNDTQLKVGAGNNATTLEAQRIASDRARETQLAIDGRTLTPVIDENGVAHYQPKSQAVGGEAPQTTDSVVANMLRRQAAAQPVTAAQPTTGAPPNDPFANVNPRILKKAGLDLPEQTLVHPATGQVGVSRDGGRTLILPDGATAPSTGFLPVGQDAALTQARDNNVRAGAANPLVIGDPANSKAAADARETSGLGPALKTDLNHTIGAIPGGPAILQGAFGTQEVGPGTQRARSDQDIRNNQARAVLLGGPGRQTVQAQKWVNELIPQGDAFSNPATEAAKIPTIVNALKGDHEQIRQLVIDPNTLPAERVKLSQQLHQIENTIRMYTDPAPAAGAQPQATTRASAPPATAPQPGAAQPPVPGARQAPDGHFYVQQDGKYFRVEQ